MPIIETKFSLVMLYVACFVQIFFAQPIVNLSFFLLSLTIKKHYLSKSWGEGGGGEREGCRPPAPPWAHTALYYVWSGFFWRSYSYLDLNPSLCLWNVLVFWYFFVNIFKKLVSLVFETYLIFSSNIFTGLDDKNITEKICKLIK